MNPETGIHPDIITAVWATFCFLSVAGLGLIAYRNYKGTQKSLEKLNKSLGDLVDQILKTQNRNN
jgi:biopolymer transport protein ExbB/TolQ